MYRKLSEKYAKFKRYVKWLYVLYELNTQIAICEPWEKVFCHVLLSSCISLILYATYAYVPSYCLLLVSYLMPISSNTNRTSHYVCPQSEAGICSSSQSYLT